MRKRWIVVGLFVVAAAVGAGLYGKGKLEQEKAASSPTAIQAIERIRGPGHVDYVIQEEPVKDGEVLFFLDDYPNGGFSVVTDFVRKTRYGWKYVFGGGFTGSGLTRGGGDPSVEKQHSEDYPSEFQFMNMYLASTEGTGFGASPYPMIYGVVTDPQAVSVVAASVKSGLERQAKIVQISDTFRLYYVFPDADEGKRFTLTAYDANGRKLQEAELDADSIASASSGTVASASPTSG